MSVKKEAYISEEETAYIVRIYRKFKRTKKKFNFSGYYKKADALNAAIAYRDKFIEENNIVPRGDPNHVRADNKTGYSGLELSLGKKKGSYYPVWCSSYKSVTNKKNRGKKSFAIRKYGYEEAFRLAVIHRLERANQPIPDNIIPPPMPSELIKVMDFLAKKHKDRVKGVTISLGSDPAWTVQYNNSIDGKKTTVNKRFRIAKLGYREAFILAFMDRIKGTGQPMPDVITVPPMPKELKKIVEQRAPKIKSGITGVCLDLVKDRYGNRPAWVATYKKHSRGKRETITESFLLKTYGYHDAFKLAVVARAEGVGDPIPDYISPPPLPAMLKKQGFS